MSENDKDEFKNAIRQIGFSSMNLDNPYDRVRISEWVRKLVAIDDDSCENIKKKNEYIQYLKIQVANSCLQLPFTKPPPSANLPSLPELLGTLVCEKIPGLPKPGPIAPAIIHKSPDGRAYISIKHVPGDGVLCYMAVDENLNNF
ncbi:hypothetical protein Phum_PHUM219200 [Pediculus humanus corporis]|uniref:DUF4485 domain-containing protein n=1 Tax=Pediculus humanus subsp. corporis TaxID=121224 RepID=E0VI10_PEDHC|nr:uncharacterized protein Phum_PHUM219200 [Pediculus humanus corporis]EEB13016.1 hypothetical protein Phum_PHUM219200 [Pediculus humanus corporis]